MADFEWDTVKAFGPYTTNEIIDDSMALSVRIDVVAPGNGQTATSGVAKISF